MSNVKPKNLSNKKLIQSAIEQLEFETGFHIINVEFGDSYFIFGGSKNSVCHFYIKEIPRFKFAFWTADRVDKEWFDGKMSSKTELIFFTQYERDIDKFKPSHSGFTQGIYRDAWWEVPEGQTHRVKQELWHLYDLVDTLKFMHEHPYQAYVYAGAQLNHSWDSISGFKAFRIYLRDTRYHYWYALKKWCRLHYVLHKAKKICSKLKYSDCYIELRDECWSPRIDLVVMVHEGIEYKGYMKDVNIIDRFKKKYYMDISVTENYDYYVDDNDTSKVVDIEWQKDLTKFYYKRFKDLLNAKQNNTLNKIYDIDDVIKFKINEKEMSKYVKTTTKG